MKKQHYVSFVIPQEVAGRLREALAEMECVQWCQPPPNDHGLPSFEHVFDGGDARLPALLALLRQENIQPFERIEHVYSDSDLRQASLLRLTVERREIDACGPSHGTTFDLSTGCPDCGTGSVQTSAFYAPAKVFPKSGGICVSSTELFVATEVAEAMCSAQTTGIELRQVLSAREHEQLPWWQIVPTYTMPRMSPKSRGIIRSATLPPCPACCRDGHYDTVMEPEEIVYSREFVDTDSLPDIVQTWECFGKSRIDRDNSKFSRFAGPAVLLKQKVFQILRRLGVRDVSFAPVLFVERESP